MTIKDVANMTQEEIRFAGLEAIFRELGPVGLIRFLQQFETGSGDYTEERHMWQDNLKLDDILTLIEKPKRRVIDESS
jgi:hypothetical protein